MAASRRLCLLLLLACLLSVAWSKAADKEVEFFEDDTAPVAIRKEDDFSSIASESVAAEDAQSLHDPLFPLSTSDYWGIFFSAIGIAIAAGGGIGGGGILVPLLIILFSFPAKLAIPLSNITIFGSSITNVVLNIPKRHPQADRPLVDWDLILVMEPLTIGGALVGSFLNKVLPDGILTVSLVILLVWTSKRTLEKGKSLYTKETLELEKKTRTGYEEGLELSELKVKTDQATETGRLLEEEDEEENGVGQGENDPSSIMDLLKDLPKKNKKEEEGGKEEQEEQEEETSSKKRIKSFKEVHGNNHSLPESELQKILDEEKVTPMTHVKVLLLTFVVVLLLNLIKGGGAFPSPLGIQCGTTTWWFVNILNFVWVLAISYKVRAYLIKRFKKKQLVGYRYVEGDMEWDEKATIKYPGLCFFAGFFAGLFGVGGGIVKGPLMLEMGVDPQVASATSAVMIFFTSFTATTSFVVFGLVTWDYAIMMFFLGIVFTAAGQLYVNHMIKKFGRSSYIVISIGAVITLSAILMGLQAFLSMSKDDGVHHDNSICSVGD